MEHVQQVFNLLDNGDFIFIPEARRAIQVTLGFGVITLQSGPSHYSSEYDYVTDCTYITVTHPSVAGLAPAIEALREIKTDVMEGDFLDIHVVYHSNGLLGRGGYEGCTAQTPEKHLLFAKSGSVYRSINPIDSSYTTYLSPTMLVVTHYEKVWVTEECAYRYQEPTSGWFFKRGDTLNHWLEFRSPVGTGTISRLQNGYQATVLKDGYALKNDNPNLAKAQDWVEQILS